ncbi:MAG: hypothetical protein IT288_16580 [Bdellovibrionales bacterium]|nr:hypothetical protein [Bdellovibrionales bacterium]
MKGLRHFPQVAELSQAIHDLQTFAPISPDDLALMSQWARLEPRVAEALVQYLLNQWPKISPLTFNQNLQSQPWPAALGVVLEFVDLQLPSIDRTAFRHWACLVMNGIEPQTGWPQFFYGLRKIGGKLMVQDAQFSLKPYRDWGFVSGELLVKTDQPLRRNPWQKSERLAMLRDLLGRQGQIRLADYLGLLKHQISRRQAERDLASLKGVRARGRTKARRYLLTRKSLE